MACQWEIFRNTRAPMPSQQQQIRLCGCKPCSVARQHPNMGKRSASVAERQAVLRWKPEPPKETDGDAA